MIELLIQAIKAAPELTREEISRAVAALVDESIEIELKADLLCAFSQRGETPAEIAGFARELRRLAISPPIDSKTRERGIMDVCGTGGDHQNTFNISTTVALVVASAGIPVAKHGNRAVTSRSGSADVLEALGIPIELSPESAAAALRDHDFAFFFAPHFHPVFRFIAPARRLCGQRGHPTIFNFLGPLLNPAQPAVQLVGVSVPGLCAPISHVLQELGVRRAMVVCGRTRTGHLDELSTVGDSIIAEYQLDRGFSVRTLSVADLPVQPTVLGDLAGGDCEENAVLIRRLLTGEERGPKRDAVLLNAGAALMVAGRARDILEGWEQAAALVDSGRAAAKLSQVQR